MTMNMITKGTWVEANGKRYLVMPSGLVRLTFKRNGQPVDRWYTPEQPIAQRLFALACGA